jgi:hypothetical protein
MALVPLATVEMMETRLGKPIEAGAERDRAEALISDASTLVRHEAGRTWVDAEGDLVVDVPDVAVMTAISAAIRAWYNPSQIESAQLGAVSIRYGDVWLTAVERDRIGSISRAGIQSLDLNHGFGFDGNPTEGWAPYDFTGLGAAPGDWFPIGY